MLQTRQGIETFQLLLVSVPFSFDCLSCPYIFLSFASRVRTFSFRLLHVSIFCACPGPSNASLGKQAASHRRAGSQRPSRRPRRARSPTGGGWNTGVPGLPASPSCCCCCCCCCHSYYFDYVIMIIIIVAARPSPSGSAASDCSEELHVCLPAGGKRPNWRRTRSDKGLIRPQRLRLF